MTNLFGLPERTDPSFINAATQAFGQVTQRRTIFGLAIGPREVNTQKIEDLSGAYFTNITPSTSKSFKAVKLLTTAAIAATVIAFALTFF